MHERLQEYQIVSPVSEANTQSRLIARQSGIEVSHDDGVDCYFNTTNMSSSDLKELAAYDRTKGLRTQSQGVELFEDVVFKANFIKTFKSLIPFLDLKGGERILEMGGGQAWASVLVKHLHPDCYVAASDLSPYALQFGGNYERLMDLRLDEKWAFNCREIPFDDAQFDRIFTMAAFHHFGEANDFSQVLREMTRVLKPGGKIVLLYEPSIPWFLYPLAFKAVNARREQDGVDEDVLVVSKMKRLANRLDLGFTATYFPQWQYRDGIKSFLYYFLLEKLTLLQSLTMCTVNITMEKR